jgi:hypothetical protein
MRSAASWATAGVVSGQMVKAESSSVHSRRLGSLASADNNSGAEGMSCIEEGLTAVLENCYIGD